MDREFKVVIPARYGSTRLPGKPLLDIGGKPMIQRVVERARASRAGEVVVATDDRRICEACERLGIAVEMTASSHRSGSDRVAEVIERRGWSEDTIVVNLQGDEPCMPAALIDQAAFNLAALDSVGMATLADPIDDRAMLFDPHVVKVVINAAGFALYFSRAPIPWYRDAFLGGPDSWRQSVAGLRHIGLYAYRAAFLKRFVTLDPSPLELAESLEQLRALWHGAPIHVGLAAEAPGPGVDTPEDLERATQYVLATEADS